MLKQEMRYAATANTSRELLTVQQVSRLLNVHINTVRKWSDSGLLQSCRIGPRLDRRFRREDIVNYANGFIEPE
ncbi:helix-turn-helix domain-containing protein [Chloroflexota bacterium]